MDFLRSPQKYNESIFEARYKLIEVLFSLGREPDFSYSYSTGANIKTAITIVREAETALKNALAEIMHSTEERSRQGLGGPDIITGIWTGSYVRIGTRVYIKNLKRVGEIDKHDDAWNHHIKFRDGSSGWYGRVPDFLKDDGVTPLNDNDLTRIKGVEIITPPT